MMDEPTYLHKSKEWNPLDQLSWQLRAAHIVGLKEAAEIAWQAHCKNESAYTVHCEISSRIIAIEGET